MFGVYHPIYLQALQYYVTFSNLFRHDSFGVEASVAVLNIANKLYGYESARVAQAYAGKPYDCAACRPRMPAVVHLMIFYYFFVSI